MDLQAKMKELVDQEFEEVEGEPFIMFEMGRKFSKRLGYKQAVIGFEEKFNKNQPMWYVQQSSEFFSQKLGESITKDEFIIQSNDIIDSSKEDSIGTNILVRKHLTKKTNVKKKVFVYSQCEINQIDLDPHTYVHNKQEIQQETMKEQPYEDILNLINGQSQQKKKRRKKQPNGVGRF